MSTVTIDLAREVSPWVTTLLSEIQKNLKTDDIVAVFAALVGLTVVTGLGGMALRKIGGMLKRG